jgi:hypothetical protein
MEEHKYGGRVPSLSDYLDDAMRPENEQGLVKGLESFFRSEYEYKWFNRGQSDSKYRGIPHTKAKQVLGLEDNTRINKLEKAPPKNASKLSRKKKQQMLRDAVEKGFLDEIHLRLPWHPKPFLEGKIETFPFEHDSVILYSAINSHELFKGGGETEHPKSALNDQYFKPENTWGKKIDNPETVNLSEKWSGNEIGIYMGFLNNAARFGKQVVAEYDSESDPLVLEIEVPTEKLNMLVAVEEDRKDGNFSYKKSEMTHISNLEEAREEFDEKEFRNPVKAFQHYCKIVSNADSLDPAEGIQFGVRHSIPFNWVRGVWDQDTFRKPIFEPLEKVISDLKSRYPNQMPDSVSKREIKKDYRELEDIESGIGSIANDAYRLKGDFIEDVIKPIEEEDPNRLVSNLNNGYYHSYRRNLREGIQNFGVDLDSSPSIDNIAELASEKESILKVLENLREKAKKYALDLQNIEEEFRHKDSWKEKELKKMKNDELEIIRELADLISQIPDLSPFLQKSTLKDHA